MSWPRLSVHFLFFKIDVWMNLFICCFGTFSISFIFHVRTQGEALTCYGLWFDLQAPFTHTNRKKLQEKIIKEKVKLPPFLTSEAHSLLKGVSRRQYIWFSSILFLYFLVFFHSALTSIICLLPEHNLECLLLVSEPTAFNISLVSFSHVNFLFLCDLFFFCVCVCEIVCLRVLHSKSDPI